MSRLALFAFIDALGWEILQRHELLESEAPHRTPLRTTFGYSSAAVPSILTGRTPAENGHWSCFFYSPGTSPFGHIRWLPLLRVVPSFVSRRGRVRHVVSKLLGGRLGYTGYFQIYQVPFGVLPLFDYSEKNDMFVPGGVNVGRSIFDDLHEAAIPAHVSDWRRPEDENLAAAETAIASGSPRFAFLYHGAFDALLHLKGTHHPDVSAAIRRYDERLRRVLQLADEAYDAVDFYVFSDHGQADVIAVHDLKADVERLPIRFGRDYVAMYDSTMLRCWFLHSRAELVMRELLAAKPWGRILADAELDELGVGGDPARTGELVFLLAEGHLIAPSFMGHKPVAAMHGYHPDAPGSDGMLIANQPIQQVHTIRDMYHVMRQSVFAGAPR